MSDRGYGTWIEHMPQGCLLPKPIANKQARASQGSAADRLPGSQTAAPTAIRVVDRDRPSPAQVHGRSTSSPATKESQRYKRREELLVDELSERLKAFRLSPDDARKNGQIVNKLVDNVLKELRKTNNYPASFHWNTFNSGSSYEKTKIGKPDEYDCMFTCDIRSTQRYHPHSPSRNFVGLQPTSSDWRPSQLVNRGTGGNFVCPKEFRAFFQQHVQTALQRCHIKDKVFDIRQDDGNGAAITVDVEHARSRSVIFSVDLVPAVRLLEWPDPAKHWTSNWLSRWEIFRIKEPEYYGSTKPFVVPKIHQSEHHTPGGQCKWWRLSFSAAEKEIIYHADGLHSVSGHRTCRKDVLRLLKDDLIKFYEDHQFSDKTVCSYFMKTIVLHLWEAPKSSLWAARNLRLRYIDALQLTRFCLDMKFIDNYFIEGENLLSERHISEEQLAMLKQYFKGILQRYEL